MWQQLAQQCSLLHCLYFSRNLPNPLCGFLSFPSSFPSSASAESFPVTLLTRSLMLVAPQRSYSLLLKLFLIKSPLSWSHQSSFFFPFSLSPDCPCLVIAAIESLGFTPCHRPLAPSCCHLQLEKQPDSWKKSSVLWHETFPVNPRWTPLFLLVSSFPNEVLSVQELLMLSNFFCLLLRNLFTEEWWQSSFPSESCLKIVFPLLVLPH